MRRLHLLRHAKSSWDDPGLADRERPLSARGRKAVVRIAEHVSVAGIAPDVVLCSTAERTRQTLAGIVPVLPAGVEIRLEDGLYGAGAGDVLARVRELGDAVGAALVIGHNPTLHELALSLTDRRDALERFPTGALATLAFTAPWAGLVEGGAELEDFWSRGLRERRADEADQPGHRHHRAHGEDRGGQPWPGEQKAGAQSAERRRRLHQGAQEAERSATEVLGDQPHAQGLRPDCQRGDEEAGQEQRGDRPG